MISKKNLEYFVSTIKNAHFWGSARLDYDRHLERVTVPQSRLWKFLATLNVVAHLCYNSFLIFRYIQYNFGDTKKNEQVKVLIEFAVVGHLCSNFCFHLCFFLREDAMANFINQFLSYYQGLKGEPYFTTHFYGTSC